MVVQIFLNQFGSFNGNFFNFVTLFVEYDIPLKCRCGIVNMYNCFLDSLNGLEGTAYQMLTALSENLNYHVVRNQFSLN